LTNPLPPHDLAAEMATLSAVYCEPERLAELDGLTPEAFFDGRHGWQWRGILGCAEAGIPIDPVTVASWLRDRGRIVDAGGVPYIEKIVDDVPSVHNVATYGAIVLGHWRRRKAVAELEGLTAKLKTGAADIGELAAAAAKLEELSTPTKKRDSWPAPSDLVLALGSQGPRLATGVGPIDSGWRGGALMGLLWAIGGAPGAGKTTLAVQLLHAWAEQGVPCCYLAGDEPRDGVLVRLGQHLGIDRGCLEHGIEADKRQLAEHLAALPLHVLDPDLDDGCDIVSVGKQMRAMYPEGPLVICADSLQTLAALVPDRVAKEMRGKVDHVLKQCKLVARTQRVLFILLSELSRASYKMKGQSQVEDIAAGKESGGIEYAVGALSVIRSVPKSEGLGEGLVSVTMPKSRAGRVEPFLMRQSYRFARFEVLDMAPPDVAEDDSDGCADTDELEAAVLEAVRAKPGCSGNDVAKRLGRSKETVLEAVAALVESGALVKKGNGRSTRLYVAMGGTDSEVTQ
jgi:replicative DNA helicase/biotin operon repressor